MNEDVGFAVVGGGGFARFAVSQFVQREGARLVGVYDSNAESIVALQEANHGITAYGTLDGLLADPEVDLVYIGSPPFLHYEQSLASLQAGKHVICEKPAAPEARHPRHLRQSAPENSLVFV